MGNARRPDPLPSEASLRPAVPCDASRCRIPGEVGPSSHSGGFTTRSLVAVAALTAALSLAASADDHGEGIELFQPEKVEWKDGPPSLPKGAKIAVLEGDPSKEGPFAFRVKVPDGYRIPPHTHPKTERVTVIEGAFNIGMGREFDKTEAMTVGTYGYWEAGMEHFVWTKGETVAQFHGMGPWSIKYVNPEDDPRNQK